MKQASEACDDGNSSGGDGCSASCTVEAQPRLDVLVDKQAIDTELMTTHMVTVTLGASGGFSGPVTLAASVVDNAGATLQGWNVALDNTTVNVAADGTASAIATLTIPSTNRGLAGTLKIDATSSLGAKQATSAVTVANQVTIPMTLNNGLCVYPAAGTVNVTIGSKLRFVNKAADNITIHVNNGNANGVPHQPDPGSPPNGAYERTLTGTPGGPIGWYCHAPGPTVNNLLIQPVAAQ